MSESTSRVSNDIINILIKDESPFLSFLDYLTRSDPRYSMLTLKAFLYEIQSGHALSLFDKHALDLDIEIKEHHEIGQESIQQGLRFDYIRDNAIMERRQLLVAEWAEIERNAAEYLKNPRKVNLAVQQERTLRFEIADRVFARKLQDTLLSEGFIGPETDFAAFASVFASPKSPQGIVIPMKWTKSLHLLNCLIDELEKGEKITFKKDKKRATTSNCFVYPDGKPITKERLERPRTSDKASAEKNRREIIKIVAAAQEM